MRFSVNRESILRPLQAVAGAVERRHTLPVLSNLLMRVSDGLLTLVGTDLEVELTATVHIDDPEMIDGATTVPARKLVDICRTLPDDAQIKFECQDDRLILRSGRSRFTLSTLPDSEFPQIEDIQPKLNFQLPQLALRQLVEHTQFSMANQDVRYYLNGMLFETSEGWLTAVATDGHRLALSRVVVKEPMVDNQCIVPRKGVLELIRLLDADETLVTLSISDNHMRVEMADFTFTSKLVDGRFPDYRRVLPRGGNNIIEGDKDTLKQAFSRVAILSNEKFRGVRMLISQDEMKISANNPEQEEAEEAVAVNYQGVELEVGFNVSYLLDVLNTLSGERVRITLIDASSSALVEDAADDGALYVVMPMRL